MKLINRIIDAQADYTSKLASGPDVVYLSANDCEALKSEVHQIMGPLYPLPMPLPNYGAGTYFLGMQVNVDPMAADGDLTLGQLRPTSMRYY